jgi:hypothetical protein
MVEGKTTEFASLFQEFTNSYISTADGLAHIEAYDEQRRIGRQNFQLILEMARDGEDYTEQALLKLLPYTNTASNRQQGGWIHIAPAVQGNMRVWFEGAGWTKAEDWPHIAEAILRFVSRCNEDPDQLPQTCSEFSGLPYSKGFQTGMLTPILNALRPDDFLIVNNKSRQTINHFAGTSYSSHLTDYPAVNTKGHELIGELAEEMELVDAPELRIADRFDMFSHWLVAVRKYFNTRYWKIAPGKDAWQWDEWPRGNFMAIGWDDLGDISGLSRAEFEERRDELITQHDDWTKTKLNQVWAFAHQISEGDRVVANQGINKVLGIGTVIGPYEFVPGVNLGHRRLVRWDDLTTRQVLEGGWVKALRQLNREKFESIQEAPPVDEHQNGTIAEVRAILWKKLVDTDIRVISGEEEQSREGGGAQPDLRLNRTQVPDKKVVEFVAGSDKAEVLNIEHLHVTISQRPMPEAPSEARTDLQLARYGPSRNNTSIKLQKPPYTNPRWSDAAYGNC